MKFTGSARHSLYGKIARSHVTGDGRALLTLHADGALCMWDTATYAMSRLLLQDVRTSFREFPSRKSFLSARLRRFLANLTSRRHVAVLFV